jgi:2-dehydropantoate 2-reductase
MNIVVIGAGRIGSTIAFHLSRAGHATTVVARGARFEVLRSTRTIISTDGRSAPVDVVASLNAAPPFDLAIVTVPEHQIDALLPMLAAVDATTVLFMFNTFKGTERYRMVAGSARFAFGFPNMTAYLVGDRLRFRVDGPGMVTTLTRSDLALLFKQAGMPAEVESDMDSFLKSHVALTVPLFVAALLTWRRAKGLTWKEARQLDAAWMEGFALVRSLGHALRPTIVAALSRMPAVLRAGLLWAFSRSKPVRDLGEFGPAETRSLIDAMAASAPGRTPHLLALRP